MISVLGTISPPKAEPITIDQAGAHLRLDTSDPMLPMYISAARSWAETFLGRALISQQLVWTVAASPPPGGWPMVGLSASLLILPQWISWDQLWGRPLTLPRQPVISVDAVGIGCWGQADAALTTPNQFGVNFNTGQVNIYSGTSLGGHGHFDITFTAGYGTTGAAVPAPILQAILLMTAFLYEQRGDLGGDPPEAAKMLLNPYRLVTFA